MDARTAPTTVSLGLLVLRLGVGGFLLTHGLGKLRMVLAGDFDKFGDPIGLGSAASLVLVTFAEFLCSLLVIVGWKARLAALPVVFAMGVAAFVAHGGDPWTMQGGAAAYLAGEAERWSAKEPALLYLLAFATVALTGAGRFSFDGMLGRRSA